MATAEPPFPIAYLVTLRTYGTWLHGDDRGSQNRLANKWSTPKLAPNRALERAERAAMKHPAVQLGPASRAVLERTFLEVCKHRGWRLAAMNVRSEHAHLVVSAQCRPELVLASLKAWASRRVYEEGLNPSHQKMWSRHGSTLYLWTASSLQRAVAYVHDGQDGWDEG
jgi:REP element-mobilizing transposase RayT